MRVDVPQVFESRLKAPHSGMYRYGNESLSQWSSIQGSNDPEWIAEEIGYVIPKS